MEKRTIPVLATGMHPTLEQLQAFDSGQMAEPDASTVEDHLATCADCIARLEHGLVRDSLSEQIRAACQCDPVETTPVLTRFVPTGYELAIRRDLGALRIPDLHVRANAAQNK